MLKVPEFLKYPEWYIENKKFITDIDHVEKRYILRNNAPDFIKKSYEDYINTISEQKMAGQKNDVPEIRPPFSPPVTEFLKALGVYFKFCIKPKVTCGDKILQKPDWYVAFNQIERLPVEENETGFDMRRRHFAEIAMANVKLKSLKREYKFAKKWHKRELKKDIKIKLKALIKQR